MRTYSTPFITCLLIAVLYTGCTRTPVRYTLTQPIIAPATISNSSVPPGQPYSFSDFSLRVTVPVRDIQTACNFSLPGNAAYATTIYIPDPILIDKIEELHIYTLNAYNNNYVANTDITSICTFNRNTAIQSIDEIIEGLNNEYGSFGDGSIDERYRSFNIELNESPSSSGDQQFIIELITDKNSRLADTTGTFTLTL